MKARVFQEGFNFGEYGNTGFGLYIVKKTMERYGAMLWSGQSPSGYGIRAEIASPLKSVQDWP